LCEYRSSSAFDETTSHIEEETVARPVMVNIPHTLGKEEARRRIEQGFGQLRQQMTGGLAGMLAFQERWEGDRLHFEGSGMGQKLTGRVDVLADSVQVQLDLPEVLAALADLITARVTTEGQKLLERK
jgi:Putative polyhydroxyalkanoic acid system protein (PHA_gran_rgn)